MSIFGTVQVSAGQTKQLFGPEQFPVLIQNQSPNAVVLTRTAQVLADTITLGAGQSLTWGRQEPCWVTNTALTGSASILVAQNLRSSNLSSTALAVSGLGSNVQFFSFNGTVVTANTFQSVLIGPGDTAITTGPVLSLVLGNPGADTLKWGIAEVGANTPGFVNPLFTQPAGSNPFVWQPPGGIPREYQAYVTAATAGAEYTLNMIAVGPIINAIGASGTVY